MANGESLGSCGIRNSNGHSDICWLAILSKHGPILVEAAHWREHTYEVLNSLDETVGQLSDAETGQRGYLLTGDETYLEPYRAAIKTVDQTVARPEESYFRQSESAETYSGAGSRS